VLRSIDDILNDLELDLEGELKAGVTRDSYPYVQHEGISFYRFPLEAKRHNARKGVHLGLKDYGFGPCLDGAIELILKDISFRYKATRGTPPHSRCNVRAGSNLPILAIRVGFLGQS